VGLFNFLDIIEANNSVAATITTNTGSMGEFIYFLETIAANSSVEAIVTTSTGSMGEFI